MTRKFTALAAFCTVGVLGLSAASAMPRADITGGTAATSAAPVEAARLVCNYRRCWHTGYRGYWYRPYGYYRPYWRPHVGIGIGPFGVGIY